MQQDKDPREPRSRRRRHTCVNAFVERAVFRQARKLVSDNIGNVGQSDAVSEMKESHDGGFLLVNLNLVVTKVGR